MLKLIGIFSAANLCKEYLNMATIKHHVFLLINSWPFTKKHSLCHYYWLHNGRNHTISNDICTNF